jgi:uncharacterized protein
MKSIMIALILICPILSFAASFNCKNANTNVEHMICDNQGLSDNDEQLSIQYKNALKRIDNPEDLITDQKLWLSNFRDRCQEPICLHTEMQKRMGDLIVTKKAYIIKYDNLTQPTKQDTQNEISEPTAPPVFQNQPTLEASEVEANNQNLPNEATNIDLKEDDESYLEQAYESQELARKSQKTEIINITRSNQTFANVPDVETSVKAQADEVQITQPYETRKSSWFSNIVKDIKSLLFATLLGSMALVFIFGISNKWVVYYDTEDLGYSFISFILPWMAKSMFYATPFETSFLNFIFNWIAAPIVGFIGISAIYFNFENAIKHNKNLYIGLLVGVFKVVFTAVTSISAVLQALRFVEAKSRKDMAMSALIVVILGWIAKKMVNGERVYNLKNWTLPVST